MPGSCSSWAIVWRSPSDTPNGRRTANSGRNARRCSRRPNHEKLEAGRVKLAAQGRFGSAAVCLGAAAAVAAWLDARYGWITPVFDAVAHQFYEAPILAWIRRPSQLVLVRWHLAVGAILLVLGLLLAGRLSRHGRRCLAVFALGYALRAAVWICGGDLPLVRADSCHY